MISILDGASKYCFYWRGEKPPPAEPDGHGEPCSFLMPFSTESQARFFLQKFQQSWDFRRLTTSDPLADPVRWSPDQVLSYLARQMATGRLLVERRWRQFSSTPPTPVSRVIVPRKANTPDKPPPVEPPTFPPQNDSGSQAESLASAAASGSPFCEECERAAREQAAASSTPTSLAPVPPPAENSFPANHNAAAQARTLTDAAAAGVPFCEECEQARQQQAA